MDRPLRLLPKQILPQIILCGKTRQQIPKLAKSQKFSQNRADLGNQLINETQTSPCYEMLDRRVFRTFSINIMNNFSYTARVFHSASAVIDRSRKQKSAVPKGLRSILNLWSGISTGLSKIIARVQSNEAYTQYLYESVHFARQNIFSPSKRCAVPRFYHELTKTVHESPYTSEAPQVCRQTQQSKTVHSWYRL